MVVCRWPKYQVHTCIFFAWKLADGPNIRYAHILHIADGKWPNTRYRHVLHMADGPNTTYTFFTQVGRWPKHQVHACTCAYFSYGRWLKHQAHRCVHSLYMKMAQTPGTRIFTWKLADFPNTRYTCMHARIFFMWKSPDDPTPGTCMHTHILHMEISRWPKYQVHACMHTHIFFIWRSADGPYTRHTHILHLEVASTK